MTIPIDSKFFDCPACPQRIEILDPIQTDSVRCPGCGSSWRVSLLDVPGNRAVVLLDPA